MNIINTTMFIIISVISYVAVFLVGVVFGTVFKKGRKTDIKYEDNNRYDIWHCFKK